MDSAQQKLLDEGVDSLIKKFALKEEGVIIKDAAEAGETRGAKEAICALCLTVIGTAIWDGIKWLWTYFEHNCSPPPPPPPPPHPPGQEPTRT